MSIFVGIIIYIYNNINFFIIFRAYYNMIKAFEYVPPILIGYLRPHKPNLLSKGKCRQVSIDVRKNQIHIYEQEEECLLDQENNEERDNND